MATTSKYELDFLEAFLQCEDGQISVQVLAEAISHRLDELAKWAYLTGSEGDADDIHSLWERFDFMAGDSTATVEELDGALEAVYDWADNPVFNEEGSLVKNMILCRVRSTPSDS